MEYIYNIWYLCVHYCVKMVFESVSAHGDVPVSPQKRVPFRFVVRWPGQPIKALKDIDLCFKPQFAQWNLLMKVI